MTRNFMGVDRVSPQLCSDGNRVSSSTPSSHYTDYEQQRLIPRGFSRSNYLLTAFSTLREARHVASSCNYDTIIAQDLRYRNRSGCTEKQQRKGAKVFFAGNWKDIVCEMYLTDINDRCFYEVIFSSPFVPSPSALFPDQGKLGARFVLDIDTEIVQNDAVRRALLARLLHRATIAVCQCRADSSVAVHEGDREYESILLDTFKRVDSLLFGASGSRTLCEIRVEVCRWVQDALRALGLAVDSAHSMKTLDASCFRMNSETVPESPPPAPAPQILGSATVKRAVCKLSLHMHFPHTLLRMHAVDGAILASALNAAMVGKLLFRCASILLNRCCQTSNRVTAQGSEQYDEGDALLRMSMCALLLRLDHITSCEEESVSANRRSCLELTRRQLSRMGIVDESVYGESRCFRVWLSSKRGQKRPLRRIHRNGALHGGHVTMEEFARGMDELRIAFSRSDSMSFTRGYELGEQDAFPPLPRTCLRRLRNRPTSTLLAEDTGVFWEARKLDEEFLKRIWAVFQSVAPSTDHATKNSRNRSQALAAGRNYDDTTNLGRLCARRTSGRPRKRAPLRPLSTMVYGTATMYTDTGAPLLAIDMIEGVDYHCQTCDCEPHDVPVTCGMQSGPPDLNPSAVCLVTKDYNLALYCFSCTLLFLVRPILNYRGFDDTTANITVDHRSHRYFPVDSIRHLVEQSMQTVSPDTISKLINLDENNHARYRAPRYRSFRPLIAINAPMGSGKTQAAAAVSALECVGTVLILTHRRSLARQLAQRFNATCYLDVLAHEQLDAHNRVVVCVNSLWRIRTLGKYRLVVVDEAGFVRRHFACSSFAKQNKTTSVAIPHTNQNTLRLLGGHFYHAFSVLLLQDGLSDEDVALYASIRGTKSAIIKILMTQPEHNVLGRPVAAAAAAAATSTVGSGIGGDADNDVGNNSQNDGDDRVAASNGSSAVPYELVDDFWTWLAELCDAVVRRCEKVFVACSTFRDATELFAYFQGYYSKHGEKKFALVSSKCVYPKDLGQADNFASRATEFDGCFVTSTLETGVSLSGHYTYVFGCFRRSPIVHTSQAQLVSRARNPKRVLIFAEEGHHFLRRTTVPLLRTAWKVDNSVPNVFGVAASTNGDDTGTDQDRQAIAVADIRSYALERDTIARFLVTSSLTNVIEENDTVNYNEDLWMVHRGAIRANNIASAWSAKDMEYLINRYKCTASCVSTKAKEVFSGELFAAIFDESDQDDFEWHMQQQQQQQQPTEADQRAPDAESIVARELCLPRSKQNGDDNINAPRHDGTSPLIPSADDGSFAAAITPVACALDTAEGREKSSCIGDGDSRAVAKNVSLRVGRSSGRKGLRTCLEIWRPECLEAVRALIRVQEMVARQVKNDPRATHKTSKYKRGRPRKMRQLPSSKSSSSSSSSSSLHFSSSSSSLSFDHHHLPSPRSPGIHSVVGEPEALWVKETEKTIYEGLCRSKSVSRNLFVYISILDYLAMCQLSSSSLHSSVRSIYNTETLEDKKKTSFWTAIDGWMRSAGPSPNLTIQEQQKSVIEVLRAMYACECMFGSALPDTETSFWVKSDSDLEAICQRLDNWRLPRGYPKSAEDSSDSLQKLVGQSRTEKRNVCEVENKIIELEARLVVLRATSKDDAIMTEAGTGAPSDSLSTRKDGEGAVHAQKRYMELRKRALSARASLGKRITRFIFDRLRVSVYVARRRDPPAAYVRPYSAATFAMGALALVIDQLPLRLEDYRECEWHFFGNSLKKVYQAVNSKYTRPISGSLDTEKAALAEVSSALAEFREDLNRVSRLCLHYSELFPDSPPSS